MQKHFLKFRKVFANIACSPLIFVSNNSELVAKYLPNEVEGTMSTLEIKNIKNGLFHKVYTKQKENLFFAENKENINQESVLISEIII